MNVRSLKALFALTAMLALTPLASALAETRVALVIGNGAYQNAPRLPNPVNDAADVAAALRRSGFETIELLNLDKAAMDEATIRFARAARTADVAMFYYSGHALQFAGANYLVPVDARLSDEADLRRMTRVDDIVVDLQQAKSLRILVLDSCRDNPLAEELRRSIGTTRALPLQRGLARIDSPKGTIVAYATQAGRTAEDGRGRNSPYTTALLQHIETREEIGTVFRRVSAQVYTSTNQVQLPELSLSLIGEFYLNGKPNLVGAPSPVVPSEAERAWAVTQNTTSVAVLEEFIRQFGGTPYGGLARARLAELRRMAVVAPPNPTLAPPTPPTYDASWHKASYWAGEYSNGFTMKTDATIQIRDLPDPKRPKSVACLLKQGTVYHSSNESLVASDRLQFITFTKIVPRTVKVDFTVKASRESDGREATLRFKKGEKLFYLAYRGEGTFLFKFRNTLYFSHADVDMDKFATRGSESQRTPSDEWLGLTCANGATGWILFKEVEKLPGFGPVEGLG
jgi:hypothetical protein